MPTPCLRPTQKTETGPSGRLFRITYTAEVSDSIRANCDEMVASPHLIAISILSILSSHMYDSYGCIEDSFKAFTCLWVHNIWRVHVYAPKPHLTFSGYDESLMMTSMGFHIFGPQINKVVRGVGQWPYRSVCLCVHVSLSAPLNSHTQRVAVKRRC